METKSGWTILCPQCDSLEIVNGYSTNTAFCTSCGHVWRLLTEAELKEVNHGAQTQKDDVHCQGNVVALHYELSDRDGNVSCVNRSAVGGPEMRRKVKAALIVFVLLLLSAAAGHFCGYEQGYDLGYNMATAQQYSTFKEQIKEGKDFFIHGMPTIKFMPRADGAVKYSMAGAGSDNYSAY